MNTSNRLIGPAGRLADLFARTLEESARVKLLLTGSPGIGKTALALQTARNLCAGEWGVTNLIGRKVTIHVVNQWEEEFASSSLYGSGWKGVVIEEIDTCQRDALDALLFVLDTLPANRAIIGTTNLPFEDLPERFRTRFQRHEVFAPEPDEIARFLCTDHGVPALVAQQIAFLCGGNVRAALIDAQAWAGKHNVKSKSARVLQPSFTLGDGISA
jgi:DNA polymerase III delta prime subunit